MYYMKEYDYFLCVSRLYNTKIIFSDFYAKNIILMYGLK